MTVPHQELIWQKTNFVEQSNNTPNRPIRMPQEIRQDYRKQLDDLIPENCGDRASLQHLKDHKIYRRLQGGKQRLLHFQVRLQCLSSSNSSVLYQVSLGNFIVYVRLHLLRRLSQLGKIGAQGANYPNTEYPKTAQPIRKTLTASKFESEVITNAVKEVAITKLSSALQISIKTVTELSCDLVLFKDHYEYFLQDQPTINEDRPPSKGFERDLKHCLLQLHSLHICHRNIRPENCLWSQRLRRYVLCDFGLAQYVEEDLGQYTLTKKVGSASDSPTVQYQQERKDLYTEDVQALLKVITAQREKELHTDFSGNVEVPQSPLHSRSEISMILGPPNSVYQEVEKYPENRENSNKFPFSIPKFVSVIQEARVHDATDKDNPSTQRAQQQKRRLTLLEALAVRPIFTVESIEFNREILGRHRILDDIEQTIRNETLEIPNRLLSKYYELIHIKIWGLKDESQKQLAQLRRSNCQLARSSNFELLNELLVSHGFLSRAFREFYISDLHRCVTHQQKISDRDREYLTVLTRVLDRDMRFKNMYEYVFSLDQTERCFLLAILYGTLGPNEQDEEETAQFKQNMAALLYMVLIQLSQHFPWCAAQTLHLLRLVLGNSGRRQSLQIEEKVYDLCFKHLSMPEEDEDPLGKLARLNLKIFRTSLGHPTKIEMENLADEIYQFNLKYCEVFPPREIFEFYGMISKLIPQKQNRNKQDSVILRHFRPRQSNPMAFNSIIHKFYMLLAQTRLQFKANNWNVGYQRLLEARRIYKQNPEKLVFMDWAQLELTNAHYLIRKQRYRDVEDIVEKIERYLPNVNEANQQRLTSLKNQLIAVRIQVEMLLGRFSEALVNSNNLSRTLREDQMMDPIAFEMHRARLKMKCGDYEGSVEDWKRLRVELLKKQDFISKKRLVRTNLQLSQLYLGGGRKAEARHLAKECLRKLKQSHLPNPELYSSTYFVLATIAHSENKEEQQLQMCWNVLQHQPSFDTQISRLVINGIDHIWNEVPRFSSIMNSDILNPKNTHMSSILQNNYEEALKLLVLELSSENQPLSQKQHLKLYFLKCKLLTVLQRKQKTTPELAICTVRLMLELALHVALAGRHDARMMADTLGSIVRSIQTLKIDTHSDEKQQIDCFAGVLLGRSVDNHIEL